MSEEDRMLLTLEMASAYVRKHDVNVTTTQLEQSLVALELPAMCVEVGSGHPWYVHPDYIQAVRDGDSTVLVARSVRALRARNFERQDIGTRLEPIVYVSTDDLDDWAKESAIVDSTQVPETHSREDIGHNQHTPNPGWRLAPADVQRTYIPELRDYLSDALERGEPLPKARDVLKAWAENPPHGIDVVDGLRGFTCAVDGEKVSDQYVSAENLGRAIARHTEAS